MVTEIMLPFMQYYLKSRIHLIKLNNPKEVIEKEKCFTYTEYFLNVNCPNKGLENFSLQQCSNEYI